MKKSNPKQKEIPSYAKEKLSAAMTKEFKRCAEAFSPKIATIISLTLVEVDASIKMNAQLNHLDAQEMLRAFFETVARLESQIALAVREETLSTVHQKN
jgi:hypothetical protein